MSRVFDFPVEIASDNIQATLEHGLLKIYVPRAATGRRKVIGRVATAGTRAGRAQGASDFQRLPPVRHRAAP
jgi:hypothetical protein